MMSAFLPCPFCGQTDPLKIITGAELMDDEQEYWTHSESFAVICNAAKPDGPGGCGACGGFGNSEADAVANWNKRRG